MSHVASLGLVGLVAIAGFAQVQAARGGASTPVAVPPAARVVVDNTPSISGVAPDKVPAIARVAPVNAQALIPTVVGSEPEPLSPGPTITTARRQVSSTHSCKASELKLTWPLAGAPGKRWVTHNYTDLDPSAAKKDWKGKVGTQAINYDGHRGYDIDIPSFREMDANAMLAHAAAGGRVVRVEDSKFDRNMSCTGDANFVEVLHGNGYMTRYLHLKKGSAKVKVGDNVFVGQPLGVVGSSGCSTAAHLHFEVRNCDNDWVEPAKEGMWLTDPATYEVSGILDVMMRVARDPWKTSLTSEEIKDPVANPTTIRPSQLLLVGFSAALKPNDVVSTKLFKVNATTDAVQENSWTVTFPRYGHGFVYWKRYAFNDYTGPVLLTVFVNGQAKAIRGFTVSNDG